MAQVQRNEAIKTKAATARAAFHFRHFSASPPAPGIRIPGTGSAAV